MNSSNQSGSVQSREGGSYPGYNGVHTQPQQPNLSQGTLSVNNSNTICGYGSLLTHSMAHSEVDSTSIQVNRTQLPTKPPCPQNKERLECTEQGYGVKVGGHFLKMPAPPSNIKVHQHPLESVVMNDGVGLGNEGLRKILKEPLFTKEIEYLSCGSAYTDVHVKPNAAEQSNISQLSSQFSSQLSTPLCPPALPQKSLSVGPLGISSSIPPIHPGMGIGAQDMPRYSASADLRLEVYSGVLNSNSSNSSSNASHSSHMSSTNSSNSSNNPNRHVTPSHSNHYKSISNSNHVQHIQSSTNHCNNNYDNRNLPKHIPNQHAYNGQYNAKDAHSVPSTPGSADLSHTPNTKNIANKVMQSGIDARQPSNYKPQQNPLHVPRLVDMSDAHGDADNDDDDENEAVDDKKKRLRRKAELARASRLHKKTKLDELEAENALLRKQLREATIANANSANIPGFDIQMTLQSVANCIIPALQVLSGHTKIVATINDNVMPALVCDTPEALIAALQKGVMATQFRDILSQGVQPVIHSTDEDEVY